MKNLALLAAGLSTVAALATPPPVHKNAFLSLREEHSQPKLVNRVTGSSKPKPKPKYKGPGKGPNDSNSDTETDEQGRKLNPIPKGTKEMPLGKAAKAKLREMRAHKNDETVNNDKDDSDSGLDGLSGAHVGEVTVKSKGKEKKVKASIADYSPEDFISHTSSLDVNDAMTGRAPGESAVFDLADKSTKLQQRKTQQSKVKAVGGTSREEKSNAMADHTATDEDGSLIYAPLVDSNKERGLSARQKQKAVNEDLPLAFRSLSKPEDPLIPDDAKVIFAKGHPVADAPETADPKIYLPAIDTTKGADHRPKVKKTRSGSPERLDESQAKNYRVRDYANEDDYDGTSMKSVRQRGIFKKPNDDSEDDDDDDSDGDDQMTKLKVRSVNGPKYDEPTTSVHMKKRQVEVEDTSDTTQNQSKNTLTQEEIDFFVEYFEGAQTNLTDSIWPYLEEMVGRSSDDSIYSAALSIFSELTYSPMKVVGGPFTQGRHRFDGIEEKLEEEGISEENLNILYAAHGDLIDLYTETWDAASQVVDQSGLLDDLDFIINQLSDVDSSALPEDWTTIQPEVIEKFASFLTPTDATTTEEGDGEVTTGEEEEITETKTINGVVTTITKTGGATQATTLMTRTGTATDVARNAEVTEVAEDGKDNEEGVDFEENGEQMK